MAERSGPRVDRRWNASVDEDILCFQSLLFECLWTLLSAHDILSQVRRIDSLASMLGQLLIWNDRYDVCCSLLSYVNLIGAASASFDLQVHILEMRLEILLLPNKLCRKLLLSGLLEALLGLGGAIFYG